MPIFVLIYLFVFVATVFLFLTGAITRNRNVMKYAYFSMIGMILAMVFLAIVGG